jgi:hypothetical protein
VNIVLREIQQQFMQGILRNTAVPGVLPPAAVSIYANNARVNFIQTLKLTYPAIWRLVGEDYFRQCAREFQQLRPSRSGDLQHVGQGFAGYLETMHGADAYRYLPAVARLEWAYQEALIESELAPMDLNRLARVEPQDYLALRFRLQPSARLLESAFPILAIWEANVLEGPAAKDCIDLDAGADRLLVVRTFGEVRIHTLTTGDLAFLTRLLAGDSFATAVESACDVDAEFDPAVTLRRFVALRAIVDFYT